MYFKKPSGEYFELVAVTRIYVLERNRAGDVEARMELADGSTLGRVYTWAEYNAMLTNPPAVIT